MNMKKKSLVAGLLAVSLAAQPVAATIAPKAVHAADTKKVDVPAVTKPDEFGGAAKVIVEYYINKGNAVVYYDEIEKLEEKFEKYNAVQKQVAKDSCKVTGFYGNKNFYEVYELIVKEWKDSTEVNEAAKKVALEYAKKLRAAATIKDSTVTLDEKKIDDLYQEYRKLNKDVRKELANLTVNEKGEEAKEDDTDKVKVSKLTDKLIEDLKNSFVTSLGFVKNATNLDEIQKFIDDFNSKENFDKYDIDVLDLNLAKALATNTELVNKIDALAAIYVPVYENKFASLHETYEVIKEDKTKEKVTVIKASVEEYEKVLNDVKELPAIILGTKDVVGFNYKEDNEKEPIKTEKIDVKSTLKISEKEEDLKSFKKIVEDENKKIEKVVAAGSKTKALTELQRIEKLNNKAEDTYAPGVYKSIDKDLIAKLNAIVEGKPVAPVKETYYSLGVNVRDAEENLLGRLDRGFVIENAVKKGNYVHFTYEGKEAKAHINFVSKEKPLDAFYSKGGNVRETPDTKGLKLGYLPVNQIVLGEVTEDGVWVEIEFNGRKAFIANNRLSKEAVEVRYTSVGANVRNAAGEKVGYYKAGEVFKGVKEGNRIKVDYKGAVGYVHVAFVK